MYIVERMVGQGGMGIAYLARHEPWNYDVVLKVPAEKILKSTAGRHQVIAEAQAWTELSLHSHVAYCYYVHLLHEIPVMVVEYLAGGNLDSWVAEGRGVDILAGLDLAIQACHGLEHAHRNGLIHRDVKPANMLLSSEGGLKVTDFGLTRARRRGNETEIGLGTYEYMAPELFKDAEDFEARTDVFALGVCLYELFCGRRPYEPYAVGSERQPADPRRLRRYGELPAQLCDLLRRCVAWRRNDRPPSMVDVRRELCTVYEGLAGAPSRYTNLVAPWSWMTPLQEAALFHNRGVSYYGLARYARALDSFDTALKFDSRSAATWNARGKTFERLERIDEALDCYLQATKVQRQNSPAWLNHGLLLHRVGHTLQAKLSYARALKADPRNAQAHDAMGVAEHELGKLSDAIQCFERAIAVAPANASVWSNLGFTLSRLSKHEEALSCYERALELDPQNVQAWDNLIALLERLRRPADATAARITREAAVRTSPALEESLELLG